MYSSISEIKEESASSSVAPRPSPSSEKTTHSIEEAQTTKAMAISNMAAVATAVDTAITLTVAIEEATAVHPLMATVVATATTLAAVDTNNKTRE